MDKPSNIWILDLSEGKKKRVDDKGLSDRSVMNFIKHKTSLILSKNLISEACICDRTLFVTSQD